MKLTRTLQLSFFPLVVTARLQAATYYVNAARTDDSGAGTSWSTAKRTIQAAVDLAVDGDTVLVTNGVYNSGSRAAPTETLMNRVVIDKRILVKSVEGPANTVIEGSGTNCYGTASAVRCVFLGAQAKVHGFTMRFGATHSGTSGYNTHGGGICASPPYATDGISNCIVRECIAVIGGGISYGVGHNSVLSQNHATSAGGGSSFSALYSCVLYNNSAPQAAGQYYGTRVNCTIVDNRASSSFFTGGGVAYGSTYNCIIWNNTRNGLVDNFFLPSQPTVGSDTNMSYTCTAPLPLGKGNITLDPRFLSQAAGDYRLSTVSPCIDAGTNSSYLASVDILGQPRVQNRIVDMGACEGGYEAVSRMTQTVAFAQLPGRTYGDAPFALAATASSGLAVQYTNLTPGVIALLSNSTVRILGAGNATIVARQPGDATYEAAAPVTNTFAVSKATLTVQPLDAARVYGATNPIFTNTYAGFVNGENASVIDSKPTASSTANPFSPAGDYPIKPSCGSDNNYAFLFHDGTLTVTPRALVVQVADQSKTYGESLGLGAQAFTVSGLITNLGDAVSAVVLASDGAPAEAGAGAYDILASGATGPRLSNYAITYVSGTLTVNPAPLTITAQSQNKPYGEAFVFSGTEFSADGLKNQDAVTSVTLASSGADADASVGPHAITPSDARGNGLANYAVAYADGTLLVGVPAVTFSPGDGSCFTSFVRVTLATALPDAAIRYTLDGSAPGEACDLYTNALTFTTTTRIRARAFFEDAEPGPVTEATLTRLYGFSVAGGSVTGRSSGFFPAGTNLDLVADPPPAGSVFGWWSVVPAGTDLGAAFSASQPATSLAMPAQTLALSAVYVPDPSRTHGFLDVRLTDATDGHPLDAAEWSPGRGAWYPQGICPLAAGRHTLRFRSSDPHWIPPGPQRTQVVAGNTETVTVTFVHVAIVSAAAEGDGSVTLSPASGQVMPGKSVTLKAKAEKASIFVQWSDGERGAVRAVAPKEDTLYTAIFAPLDQPCYQEPLLGLRLDGSDVGTVGVSFPFAQVTPAWLPATFNAAGLPPGLSISRATGVISGRPTKAGTFTASFTATGPTGGKGALSHTFTIAALPARAQGAFAGFLCDSNAVLGTFSLSVSPQGAASAKVHTRSSAHVFTAAGWASESNGVFTLTARAFRGASLTLRLDTGLGTWTMNLGGRFAAEDNASFLTVLGQRIAFKDKPLPDDAAAVLASYRGYYTATLPADLSSSDKDGQGLAQGCGFLTLSVRPGGSVWCAGRTADGQPVSDSADLIVCEDGTPDARAYVPIFFPLSGKQGLLAGLLAVEPNGSAAPDDNTVGPVETAPILWLRPALGAAEDTDGTVLRLGASGGFYNTEAAPSPEYARAWFVAQQTRVPPALSKGKTALTRAELIKSLLPNLALQLDANSGALRLPDGARPIWDSAAGGYVFDPTNPACATLSLNPQTGRFKGQFNVYYAYADDAGRPKIFTLRVSHEGVLTPVRRTPETTPSGMGFYRLPEALNPNSPLRTSGHQSSFLIEICPQTKAEE